MRSELFIVFFIILCFCIISLLALFSRKRTEKKEKNSIKAIDSELIKIIKNVYFNFLKAVETKDEKKLKSLCTRDFLKTNQIENLVSNKILFILNSKVLKFDNNILEIEFVSRSINTEILYNKLEFVLLNDKFLVNNINFN